jgi:hypothetical protein
MSIACNFSTPTKVPTNVPANDIQAPTTQPISPSSDYRLCKNNYMPIVNDTTKAYAIKTTIAGSTSSSTNYETIFYYGDGNYFTVTTRLGSKVGYPLDELWDCTNKGLTKTAFESGEFSAFFIRDENGINTRRTTDWCPGGTTLPISIDTGNTWTQQIDFKFTSSNLTGWNWFKWNILHQPLNARTLPLPAGSGRFLYKYDAVGLEQIVVTAGTYNAFRIDVTAEGYLDPSRDFSPTFENTGCTWSSYQADQVDPLMSLTFKGSTWWVSGIGWVKKAGIVSNSQGIIESYEMELESSEVP